jgi:two-component system copper resistance phosphate regulon response regulator CusR
VRTLYVEDQPTTREYISRGLAEQGIAVDTAQDGTEALGLALRGGYDLLILDVMLPGLDGFELLKEIRCQGVDTPVLFLSARSEPCDRIRGLNLGGDDYLSKPFAFAELLARIRAIARRYAGQLPEGVLKVADLELDFESHRVSRSGRRIELTPREFSLLAYLMQNAGHVLSQSMITEHVWGAEFEDYSKAIAVHINHLRKKVDQGTSRPLIHTVKGVGYVLHDRQ